MSALIHKITGQIVDFGSEGVGNFLEAIHDAENWVEHLFGMDAVPEDETAPEAASEPTPPSIEPTTETTPPEAANVDSSTSI